jgi:hypothetical protein
MLRILVLALKGQNKSAQGIASCLPTFFSEGFGTTEALKQGF